MFCLLKADKRGLLCSWQPTRTTDNRTFRFPNGNRQELLWCKGLANRDLGRLFPGCSYIVRT